LLIILILQLKKKRNANGRVEFVEMVKAYKSGVFKELEQL
jgi:hypothetical protein